MQITHVVHYLLFLNRIGGVKVNVLDSRAVDRGFGPRSGQTRYYAIGICCFSAKHVALMSKGRDWLARIRIQCPSGATCLLTDCYFSELTRKKQKSISRVSLTNGYHQHLTEMLLVLAML